MLSNLLGKLFNQEDKDKPGSARNVKHRISDISDALRLYQAENHLLIANFTADANASSKPAKMTTGILAVNAKQRQFATDRFVPRESNNLLTPGTIVHFALIHHGVRHHFECLWKNQEGEGNAIQHWFDFPKGIEQVQMRDAFRVKLSQANPVKVALTHAEKPPLAGTIADLSASGMRVRIAGPIKPKPARGEKFTSCHFVLTDGQAVVCQARLMHWQYDPDQDVTYLGIQFDQMDGGTQRVLNRFLTDIQRKQRI